MDDFAWLQPVLIAAAVVFVLDLIGNMISFSNRILNALTTALVFAVLFGALIHLGLVKMDVRTMDVPAAASTMDAPSDAPASAPAEPAAEEPSSSTEQPAAPAAEEPAAPAAEPPAAPAGQEPAPTTP